MTNVLDADGEPDENRLLQNPYLVGASVYLRPIDRADAPVVLLWMNDPEVTRTLRLYRPMSVQAVEEFIAGANQDEDQMVLGIVVNGRRLTLRQEEHASTAEAEEVFGEMLKWLYLCYRSTTAGPEGFDCAMTPEIAKIDEMWHTFILFTRDYADFCDRSFGFFLHHAPTAEEESG